MTHNRGGYRQGPDQTSGGRVDCAERRRGRPPSPETAARTTAESSWQHPTGGTSSLRQRPARRKDELQRSGCDLSAATPRGNQHADDAHQARGAVAYIGMLPGECRSDGGGNGYGQEGCALRRVIDQPNPAMSKGTARTEPPAPVRPRRMPTTMPMRDNHGVPQVGSGADPELPILPQPDISVNSNSPVAPHTGLPKAALRKIEPGQSAESRRTSPRLHTTSPPPSSPHPPPRHCSVIHHREFIMDRKLFFKLVAIGFMSLLLLIPLALIGSGPPAQQPPVRGPTKHRQ